MRGREKPLTPPLLLAGHQQRQQEVWLSGWPAGAYIARAESAGGVAARVFVKE
ncbi:MAG: hypothetical protein KF734_11475 [Saprospiraceae bacterium]|nr:hypothetical protein [Saprospiraceae bacterium]